MVNSLTHVMGLASSDSVFAQSIPAASEKMEIILLVSQVEGGNVCKALGLCTL